MQRERKFYPEDPSRSPFEPYRGVLFRYDDPEFFRIEVDKKSTILEFSTDKSPEDAASAYEAIYGKRVREQEIFEPREKTEENYHETAISLGPRGFLLVALKSYRYAWVELHAPFVDRDTPTPTITISEFKRTYDDRNNFLVSQLASPSVLADLEYTMRYIKLMRTK